MSTADKETIEILTKKLKRAETHIEKISNQNRNSTDQVISDALNSFSRKSHKDLKDFRNTLNTYYEFTQMKLSFNEKSMFRRALLLSNLGIYLMDSLNMPNIAQIIHKKCHDFKIEFPIDKVNSIHTTEAFAIASFFQVSNSGEPEANIVLLWNSILLSILSKLQPKGRMLGHRSTRSLPSPKLVLESEFNFNLVPTISSSLIAGSVLKGLGESDYPVCVIEFGAYPLDHFLHHMDVTKMGVMLSALLYQRANQHRMFGSKHLQSLRVYGMLIEDMDVEFCVARIVGESADSMMVQFSCGSGNTRYHLYDGKKDTTSLIKDIKLLEFPVLSKKSEQVLPLSVSDLEKELNLESYSKMTNNMTKIRSRAIQLRTESRIPNGTSLKVLASFIKLCIVQNAFLSNLNVINDDDDDDDDDKCYFPSELYSLINSSKSAGSVHSPRKITKQRSAALREISTVCRILMERPSPYIANATCESSENEIYIEFEAGVLYLDEAFRGQFISNPGTFWMEMVRLILDLVSATYSMHQSGYASLSYSEVDIFWQFYYVFGDFVNVVERVQVDTIDFENLKSHDYVNLCEFCVKYTSFLRLFCTELFCEQFMDERMKINDLLKLISDPLKTGLSKVESAIDTFRDISYSLNMDAELSSPSITLAKFISK
jgi:hypothetical protein